MRLRRGHLVTSAVIAVFFMARFFTTVCIWLNWASLDVERWVEGEGEREVADDLGGPSQSLLGVVVRRLEVLPVGSALELYATGERP